MKDEVFMPINVPIIQHENVNGVQLCLTVDTKDAFPRSRVFTISYKYDETRRPKLVTHLCLATMIHSFALGFVMVNITAMLAVFISFASLTFFWLTHTVQSETAVVIPSVGIQNSVQYVCGKKDNFIPWSSVDDVIINEVVRMSRVLYQLTVLVKPPNKPDVDMELVPLFKYTKPRLMMLEKIYAELQILLLDSQREEQMASGDLG